MRSEIHMNLHYHMSHCMISHIESRKSRLQNRLAATLFDFVMIDFKNIQSDTADYLDFVSLD